MNIKSFTTATAKNIFAILGFIILLIIGIWSAIQVITFVPRLFSDSGITVPSTTGIQLNGKDIVAALSTEIAESGEIVTIDFAHKGDETGVLSFTYACEEGFYFQIQDRPVPCNAPYSIPSTETALKIIPLSANKETTVALAITYTNTSGESVRDTKTLKVTNTSAAEETGATTSETTEMSPKTSEITSTSVTTEETAAPREPKAVVTTPYNTPYTYSYVPQASNPYGNIDLEVQMIAIGEITPYGAFAPSAVVHSYSTGAAKFRVTNKGTKNSGNWYFSAILPTQGGYPFASDTQRALGPNESVEILMTFDQLVGGAHNFSAHVDPSNFVPESNEYNNVTGQTINVLNY